MLDEPDEAPIQGGNFRFLQGLKELELEFDPEWGPFKWIRPVTSPTKRLLIGATNSDNDHCGFHLTMAHARLLRDWLNKQDLSD